MQKVIVKVNLKSVVDNAKAFKNQTGAKLCAVVKANAYGHGAVEIVNALSGVADCFAVSIIEEGIEISTAACGKDVLVLTPPITKEECEAVVQNAFIATVGDLRTAYLLARVSRVLKKTVKVHLKVNTGMNRYGANLSMLGKLCKLFSNEPYICVCGVYSHLYTTDKQISYRQRELFMRAKRVAKRYFSKLDFHLSATYGATLGKEFAFDMIRVGLGLYGYLPDGVSGLALKKAMSVYARCELSRKYAKGGAGYGKQSLAKKGEKLSVFRVGYADGILRTKSNGLVGWRKNANDCCMDVCIRKGGKRRGRYEPIMLNAQETAREIGTISYDVLCSISRRAEFVYEWE
ncbi:MAG: alanine racemase [Clostridia bacterium]|nr:alanine racemase [Clostridia bacterium]